MLFIPLFGSSMPKSPKRLAVEGSMRFMPMPIIIASSDEFGCAMPKEEGGRAKFWGGVGGRAPKPLTGLLGLLLEECEDDPEAPALELELGRRSRLKKSSKEAVGGSKENEGGDCGIESTCIVVDWLVELVGGGGKTR